MQQQLTTALKDAGIEIEAGLLMMKIQEAASAATEKIKAQFFVLKLWAAVGLLVFSLGCILSSSWKWHGIPALLFFVLAMVNLAIAFSAKGLMFGGLPGATVNGTPGMTIGQLFTAAFKKDVSWPDFKTSEFFKEGYATLKAFWFALGHITIVAGLLAEFCELFTVKSTGGVVIMLLAIIVLAVFSFVEGLTQTKWYKRIVMFMSIPTLVLGFVIAINPPTKTEILADQAIEQSNQNRDDRSANEVQRVYNATKQGKVLTPGEEAALQHKAAESSGNKVAKAQEILFETTKWIGINITGPQDIVISGLKPSATYRFTKKDGPINVQVLDLNGNFVSNMDLAGFMKVNGAPLGERVKADFNGSVILSFTTAEMKATRKLTPNTFQLKSELQWF